MKYFLIVISFFIISPLSADFLGLGKLFKNVVERPVEGAVDMIEHPESTGKSLIGDITHPSHGLHVLERQGGDLEGDAMDIATNPVVQVGAAVATDGGSLEATEALEGAEGVEAAGAMEEGSSEAANSYRGTEGGGPQGEYEEELEDEPQKTWRDHARDAGEAYNQNVDKVFLADGVYQGMRMHQNQGEGQPDGYDDEGYDDQPGGYDDGGDQDQDGYGNQTDGYDNSGYGEVDYGNGQQGYQNSYGNQPEGYDQQGYQNQQGYDDQPGGYGGPGYGEANYGNGQQY